MLKDLLQRNRSYRRFDQHDRIPRATLEEWVALTRFCPSGRNAQALRYRPVTDEADCDRVFQTLAWAGYLKDWPGPEPGERPSAYLVQLLDTTIEENCLCDDGIQAQTILLAAVEAGYGGCIIKAFRNDALREVLRLPDHLRVQYVLALGRPVETVVLEPMRDGDVRYWRDAAGVHHVPKRPLEELIV